MPLDATIGGPAANSYATVAEVQSYVDTHFVPAGVASKWAAATTAQREASLIRAAQLLDRHVGWRGDIYSNTQALSWPRAFAFDRYGRQISTTVIPDFLKEFQIETALWVLDQAGVLPQTDNGEFDSIRVGTLEIDFNESGANRRSLLPESVVAALAPMGQYQAQLSGGARTIPVVRA
jgi:hypothetical protein